MRMKMTWRWTVLGPAFQNDYFLLELHREEDEGGGDGDDEDVERDH